MKKISVPEFTIFSDQVDPDGSDLFAFEARLKPIFDVLRHKDTLAPMSIAVYGPSGSGKTTALEWLAYRIEQWNAMAVDDRHGHPSVFSVWFTPSLCADSNTILHDLVLDISAQILEVFGDSNQPFELPKDARSNTVLATFNAWLKECKIPSRIVVFVDGIDHCRAASTLAVLDAIGLRFKSSNLLFVVSINGAMTRQLIQCEFSEQGYQERDSRSFLHKIFTLECHIEPTLAQIRHFYIEQITLLNRRTGNTFGNELKSEHRVAINESILKLAGTTPRKVKHLLNRVTMRGSVIGDPLHFAQAIQCDLIRFWLASHALDEAIFQREEVRGWFAAISEEAIKEKSNYLWISKKQEEHDDEDEEESQGSWNYGASVDNRLNPPEELEFKMIPEWLWNLLKIPFVGDISASLPRLVELVPKVESVVNQGEKTEYKPAEQPKKPDGILSQASPLMKKMLSTALETPLADLSNEQLLKLDTLDLSGARLEPNDYPFIGKLKSLEQLELYNSSVDCLAWIKELTALKVLNLSCSKVVDLEPLSGLENLETLDLSYTMVADLAPLANLDHLIWLVLYGTPVKSIEALQGLGNLERLNLSRTHITPDELEHLEKLTSLKNLFLRNTAIRQKNIPRLKQSIGFDLEVEL